MIVRQTSLIDTKKLWTKLLPWTIESNWTDAFDETVADKIAERIRRIMCPRICILRQSFLSTLKLPQRSSQHCVYTIVLRVQYRNSILCLRKTSLRAFTAPRYSLFCIDTTLDTQAYSSDYAYLIIQIRFGLLEAFWKLFSII